MTEPSRAVFLSYASQDAEAAKRICEALRAAGIEVWFDQSELRGGDVWDQKIRREVHDCALFVPVISANTASRHEGYFRLEWNLADQRTQMMARDRAFIVPVCIDSTPDSGTDVPESFLRVQWTRLPAGETPSGFVARIAQLLSPNVPQAPAQDRMSSGSVAAARSTTPTSTGSRRRQLVALLIAVMALLAGGYFAVDRFWVSKHAAAGTASVPTAQPMILAPAAIPEKSIAVLPFVDMSEKHDQEYFADGMAEEILDLLANIPGLKVIGRTSSFQFKGKNQDLRAVGSALGARYVVEGSVRKSGGRVRITAQLIDAGDGSHVWSDTYDEPLGDALGIQDKIAANLVRALQVTVGADLELGHPFKSVEAHDLYLRGRHAYDRFNKEGLESAAAYFQQALELEPDSVAAAEALVAAQDDFAELGYIEPREGFERLRQSAQRALRLDPNSAVGRGALADVHLIYEWDWTAAERDAKEALRLKPRSDTAMGVLATVYQALGRWDESARMYESAIALDPLFPGWHVLLGNVRLAAGRLEADEAELRRTLQISPTYAGVHGSLGAILLYEGKLEEALTQMQKEQPDSGRAAGLAMVYHAMGRHAESDSALTQEIKDYAQINAFGIADVYAYRGEADKAFAWLERAYRQKDTGLYLIKGDVLLRKLANDPRYQAFLRKMNLPE